MAATMNCFSDPQQMGLSTQYLNDLHTRGQQMQQTGLSTPQALKPPLGNDATCAAQLYTPNPNPVLLLLTP